MSMGGGGDVTSHLIVVVGVDECLAYLGGQYGITRVLLQASLVDLHGEVNLFEGGRHYLG